MNRPSNTTKQIMCDYLPLSRLKASADTCKQEEEEFLMTTF